MKAGHEDFIERSEVTFIIQTLRNLEKKPSHLVVEETRIKMADELIVVIGFKEEELRRRLAAQAVQLHTLNTIMS